MSEQVLSALSVRGCELIRADLNGKCAGWKGARFDPGLTPAQWQEAGRGLWMVDRSMRWILADWLNVAEARVQAEMEARKADRLKGKLSHDTAASWGQKYLWAMELTGFQCGTLRNIAWMGRKFPMERRRGELSFAHHQEVAAFKDLTPEQQDKFLDQAAENNWTLPELRAALRNSFKEPAIAGPSLGFVPASWVQEFERFARQEDGFSDWPEAKRAALKAQLRRVVDIYESL